MGAGTINSTDITEMLKTIYEPGINSAIPKTNMLINQLQPTSEHRIDGVKVQHYVDLVLNQSVGFRRGSPDGLTKFMPKTRPSQGKQIVSEIRSLYSYLKFSGDAIRNTKVGDRSAYANIIGQEVKSLTTALRLQVNRAAYGDGTGEFGEVVEAGPTDTITVRTSSTVANTPCGRWFERGMLLDIYDPTNFYAGTASVRNTKPLTVIRKSVGPVYTTLVLGHFDGTVLTLNGTYGVTTGDKIVFWQNYYNEPYGLNAFIDNGSITTNFLGISELDFDRWNAFIVDSGAPAAFDENSLQELIDEMSVNDEGGKTLLVCDTKIKNCIARKVKGTMVQPATLELKGGFKAVSYSDKAIFADIYAPYGKIQGINFDDIVPHVLNKADDKLFDAFSFDDMAGGMLHPINDTDDYWVKGILNYNMTITRRNSFGAYKNIDPTL